MSAGVPAGAKTPYQPLATMSKPASLKVGTSGRNGERAAAEVASTLMRPALWLSSTSLVVVKTMGICPPIRSVSAAAEPR